MERGILGIVWHTVKHRILQVQVKGWALQKTVEPIKMPFNGLTHTWVQETMY